MNQLRISPLSNPFHITLGLALLCVLPAHAAAAPSTFEVARLTASDGATSNEFGFAVSVSGDTLIVGAVAKDSQTGAAYVYERNAGGLDNWGEVKKLSANDSAAGDRFGNSVWISGDTVIVGVVAKDSQRGAAYVFERNAGGTNNWGEVKKLTASDGATSDRFGVAVSISGDTIVVGARGTDSFTGSAYVFGRNVGGAGNWGEIKKLSASDAVANDRFGTSVSIGGSTVVVGAIGKDSQTGAAYVFERNLGGAGNWGEVKKLTASDAATNDRLGIAVSINNASIVVGAFGNDMGRGAAYVFERNEGGTGNWGEVKKLIPSDGVAFDEFGFCVSISGSTIVVGAVLKDSDAGAAYQYGRNAGGTNNWGEVKKLTASDGVANDRFGYSASISGKTVVMGARGKDSFTGAVYIFESPTVKVFMPDGTASEPGTNTGQLLISRTGPISTPLNVFYTVQGSATPGADYQALSGMKIIRAGHRSEGIRIQPVDDNLHEGTETVRVTLRTNLNYIVGSPSTQTMNIADDD